MKTSSIRRPAGFTLVELLVVIAIILVLSAAGFGVAGKMKQRAMMVTSKAGAGAIEAAVNAFYSEYGALPDAGSKEIKTDKGEGTKLLEVLLGLEPDGGKMQNSRKIKLLNFKETKTKSKGILYSRSGRSVEGMYDDWGNPYVVEMDTEYEERLNFNVGGKPVDLNGRRVAVYSAGADKKLGTEDDVQSW